MIYTFADPLAAAEGVVFVGRAQERTPVFRTEKRRHPATGQPYPWIVRSTAMVNHFYFYCVDRDFGPFFLKFCTYFPCNAKLCLNGLCRGAGGDGRRGRGPKWRLRTAAEQRAGARTGHLHRP